MRRIASVALAAALLAGPLSSKPAQATTFSYGQLGIRLVHATTTLPEGKSRVLSVACPQRMFSVSGGVWVHRPHNGGDPALSINARIVGTRQTNRGFGALVGNLGGAGNLLMNVDLRCAKRNLGPLIGSYTPVAYGNRAELSASCPVGSQVVAMSSWLASGTRALAPFDVRAADAQSHITSLGPVSNDEWYANVVNYFPGGPQYFHETHRCTTALPTYSVTSVDDGTSLFPRGAPLCSAGKTIAGGSVFHKSGQAPEYDIDVYNGGSSTQGTYGWFAYSTSATDVIMTVTVNCV